MAAASSAEAELQEDASSVKIGQQIWKIGDKVYSIGDQAVEKAKMVETFGDAWKTARVEGEIMGRGGLTESK